GDVRHAERKATLGRPGDRLGLSALLRADPRIGPGRVDQRQHGNREAVGHVHEPHRLAVALGPRHAEIVPQAAFRGRTLLVTVDADALAPEPAEPADDGFVVPVFAVARHRRGVAYQGIDVIEAMRPWRMARALRLLPGGDLGIEFLEGLCGLELQTRNLLGDFRRIAARLG